ncbi:MAG: imidazolonepropionase [Bacteroidales bacterium]|nr:imidazolonepropionase [Bacteroidales bacterium]
MKSLIKNIGELVGIVPAGVLRKQGAEMAETGVLKDAWLAVEDGRIAGFGKMADLVGHDAPDPSVIPGDNRESIDAKGGLVMPAFCDSHTHIVYAGSRDGEFLDKINGLSYEEIAARGGGILNSSDLLHETSEEELLEQSMVRVREMMAKGTGALEIKSGYGLNPEDELKMLRVIRRIKESVPALVRSTFLGAHAIGRGYTHEGYVQAVVDMMPEAAELADFVDVFCDEGFFTVDDTDRILTAGAACGLRPKIHANELAVSGGVQVGVKHGALSVDHLERTGDAEIEALRGSETMPTMLPGSSFFLGIPFGRAKEFIGAGLGVALASDYNPGSSPSGDMRFVMALGCIRMRLTPVQALNAVTLNSAYALGLSEVTGSITVGKRADLILTHPGWTLTKIPYLHQTPFLRTVFLGGRALE